MCRIGPGGVAPRPPPHAVGSLGCHAAEKETLTRDSRRARHSPTKGLPQTARRAARNDRLFIMEPAPTKKQRKSSLPPPPPPPQPPTPAESSDGRPKVPPAVLEARRVAQEAKRRADEAAIAAQTTITLPSTPAHNTIGEALKDVLPVYAPEGEDIVPVRLYIDGSVDVEPPVERPVYRDTVLWNVHDASFTPEAFARITREEECLPSSFEAVIAEQIHEAVRQHRKSSQALAAARVAAGSAGDGAPPGPAAAMLPPSPSGLTLLPGTSAASTSKGGGGGGGGGGRSERLVTLELHVVHESGLELRDRVLWDADSDQLTPEAFARTLCADMNIHELEGAVAFAVHEQLAKADARLIAKHGGGEGGGALMGASGEVGGGTGKPAVAAEGGTSTNGMGGGGAEEEAGGGEVAMDEANEPEPPMPAAEDAAEDMDEDAATGIEPANGGTADAESPSQRAAPPMATTLPGSVVRTERAALDWSPQIIVGGAPAAEELEQLRKAEAAEAERRDSLRLEAGGK